MNRAARFLIPALLVASNVLAACGTSRSDQETTVAVAPAATADARLAILGTLPAAFPSRPDEAAPALCEDEVGSPPTHLPAVRMSDAFLNNCANCHGTAGEGNGEYPRLREDLPVERLIAMVRSGTPRMPAFDASMISEADLRADHSRLASSGRPTAFPADLVPGQVPLRHDDVEHRRIMSEGLLAWRTPGERGACASCHGPDGVDLARIGYSNAAILRRADGQGLPPAQAMAIVRMVAAQRGRHGITLPCKPSDFVPLQPGGRVIGGADPLAKDSGLYSQLRGKGVIPAALSADAASAAALMDRIASLDVSAVPLAIQLNPWGADAFHGASRRSTAEWLPELPLEPTDTDLAAWVAAQNAYLEEPSDARLIGLLDFVPKLTSVRFGAGGASARFAREKYRSVLQMQHSMRTGSNAVRSLIGSENASRAHVWETGLIADVMARGCSDAGSDTDPFPCWKYPLSFFKKMGTDREALLRDVESVRLPWLIAGWLQDPSLARTEAGDAQMGHLHRASERAGVARSLPLHDAYISFVRLVKETESGPGCWLRHGHAIEQWVGETLPALDRMLAAIPAGPDAEAHRALVHGFVNSANHAMLWRMRGSQNAPPPSCGVAGVDEELKGAVRAMVEWHARVDQGAAAAESVAAPLFQ